MGKKKEKEKVKSRPKEEMAATNRFLVADHLFQITVIDNIKAYKEVSSRFFHLLLPSLTSFAVGNDKELDEDALCGGLLFHLIVDDSTKPVRGREKIRNFDTGNGDTIVYSLPDGGYQFIIRNIAGSDCCLLIADKEFRHCRCALNGDMTMRKFGLNGALMLVFAFAASSRQTLLIHASCVRHNGKAYPFTAMSGVGKSTHANLWLTYIEGTDLINDDNPALRLVEGQPFIYGTPWSGKTPCYRKVKVPLGAVIHIERAETNSIERLTPSAAFGSMLSSCATMKWDHDIFGNICDTVTAVVESVPVYTMRCRPDEEAARVCEAKMR